MVPSMSNSIPANVSTSAFPVKWGSSLSEGMMVGCHSNSSACSVDPIIEGRVSDNV